MHALMDGRTMRITHAVDIMSVNSLSPEQRLFTIPNIQGNRL